MNIRQIRQEYDSNYRQMVQLIQQMGGERQIIYHRKKNSHLYKKLRMLQMREKMLDEAENRMRMRHAAN
ncbi:MAG: hypothetical protein Kow0037_03640 [Calditrichia bacterium]